METARNLKDSILEIEGYSTKSPLVLRKALFSKGILATETEISKALIAPKYCDPILNNLEYFDLINDNLHMSDEEIICMLEDLEAECEAPPLYFPHNADFRSRLYPMCTGLHPQQGDVSKSILRIKKGKAIGTDKDFLDGWPSALGWLKIHVANTAGLDKDTYEDRIQWCTDNKQLIIESSEYSGDFWKSADKPFSFLAACKDLAGYWREGPEFISTVPIAMDGMCNGSQHYAMMRRDSVAAAAVSVSPSSKPKDLYTEVSDEVLRLIEQDKTSKTLISYTTKNRNTATIKKSEISSRWLNLTWDRKLTKRPTMCIVYGLTKGGAWEYVQEYLVGRELDITDEMPTVAVSYMRDRIWEALFSVLTSSMETMGELQTLARIVSKRGDLLEWYGPTGWKVIQGNMKLKKRDVEVWKDGKKIHKFSLRKPTDTINISSQVNAIAPNIIHTMDAGHLQLTVLECLRQGVESFVMIHDSFGTCAADAPIMAKALRTTFVDMYRQDVLGKLFDDHQVENSMKQGDLDPETVKESKYFFG